MILIRNDFEHHFKSNVIKILESLHTVRWPNASVSCRKSKSVSDKLRGVRDPAVHMPRAAGEVQQIAGHVAHVRLHRHRLLAVRAGLRRGKAVCELNLRPVRRDPNIRRLVLGCVEADFSNQIFSL